MALRILALIAIVLVLCKTAIGEMYTPLSFSEAYGLLNQFKEEIVTIIFVDSAVVGNQLGNESSDGTAENEFGFISSLYISVQKIFSSDEKTTIDIIREISKDNILIVVDVTLPDLVQTKEIYNVNSVPFIIILHGNKILYRDVASKRSADKIASIKSTIYEDHIGKEKRHNSTDTQANSLNNSTDNKLLSSTQDGPFLLGSSMINNKDHLDQSEVKVPLKRTPKSELNLNIPSAIGNGRILQSEDIDLLTNKNVPEANKSSATSASISTLLGFGDSDSKVMNETIDIPIEYDADNSEDFSKCTSKSPYSNNFRIEDKWENVINDEQQMIDQIQKLYDDDLKLAKTMSESEQEIHHSEELFYQARNAIEKSLIESEKQMHQYEMELDKLYKARNEAIKARDNLYGKCEN